MRSIFDDFGEENVWFFCIRFWGVTSHPPLPSRCFWMAGEAPVKLKNLLGSSQLDQTSMIQKCDPMVNWLYLQ